MKMIDFAGRTSFLMNHLIRTSRIKTLKNLKQTEKNLNVSRNSLALIKNEQVYILKDGRTNINVSHSKILIKKPILSSKIRRIHPKFRFGGSLGKTSYFDPDKNKIKILYQ